jgi:prepilin-type N-terminal cleavage/methylation domain-containing protein
MKKTAYQPQRLTTLSSSKGFTLLELLIVTAILGILASIAFALLQPDVIFGQVRDVRRKADLKEIGNALQQYYNDNKAFPDSFGAWQNTAIFFTGGSSVQLVPDYIKFIPIDRDIMHAYEYASSGTLGGCEENQSFALRTRLERLSDPQAYPNRQVTWCDGSTPIGTNTDDHGYFYLTAN